MARSWLLTVTIFVAACAGSPVPPLAAPPPPKTVADLSGPLCHGDECACRDLSPKVAQTAPGARLKRFEIRLGPSQNELWARVGNEILYKDLDRATACFYLDLAPGKYPITLQARSPHGVAVGMTIAEMGGAGKWFYDTFDFDCGAPGLCTREHLEAFKARADAVAGGKFDPCGSTRISSIRWKTGRAPDDLHPAALEVSLILDVYEFAPEHPPGDPSCEP
ncbi:MAG TPA: hypothetical protein VFG83_11670, partial [Kofleriaceae bacterium]|nr:hypothetical protein [Kofleriaceae bacterium]